MHSSNRIFNSVPAAQKFFIRDGLLYRFFVYVKICCNTSNASLSLKGPIQCIRRNPGTLDYGAPESIFRIKCELEVYDARGASDTPNHRHTRRFRIGTLQ